MSSAASPRRLRIALLSSDYPPRLWSGIGATVALQARALAAQGAEVHVFVGQRGFEGSYGEKQRECVGKGQLFVHALGHRCPLAPAELDIIHLHSIGMSDFAFALAKRSRAKLVYTAHALISQEWRANGGDSRDTMCRRWSSLQSAVMRSVQTTIFLNPEDRRSALERNWCSPLRSQLLANPVATSSQGAETRERNFIFAGRLAWSKGIDLLRQLVPHIVHTLGHRVEIIGGHADACGQRLLRQLRGIDGCRFRAWLPQVELHRAFARATAVLSPSRYEPFGLVAREALACGTPVLSAAVGGLADLSDLASGARLISSHQLGPWQAGASQLVENPALWRRLATAGPAWVKQHYAPAKIARQLLHEVYRKVLFAPHPLGSCST